MNASVNDSSKIEASLVPDHARIETMPRHFGMVHMIRVENRIYDFLRRFVRSYHGGYWRFYELSNGGFYMSPPPGRYEFVIGSNGFEGVLDADAAGITVCLFAFSHLSFQYEQEDMFARHYHLLHDFADQHLEAGLIFAAID